MCSRRLLHAALGRLLGAGPIGRVIGLVTMFRFQLDLDFLGSSPSAPESGTYAYLALERHEGLKCLNKRLTCIFVILFRGQKRKSSVSYDASTRSALNSK